MKVFGFNSSSIQGKNVSVSSVKNVAPISKSDVKLGISQDINLKDFTDIKNKLVAEKDTLDMAKIEELRMELAEGKATSNTIAEAIISEIKNITWNRRL